MYQASDAYINSILEPVVKPCIMAGEDFVLEEESDSGHGPNKKNPIRMYMYIYKNQMVLRVISTAHNRLTYRSLRIAGQFLKCTLVNRPTGMMRHKRI